MARDSLWTWGRGSPIPQSLRQKIVEQDQKGVSQRKIAKSLRLSSSTVHNIIQRFRESGTTSVRKGQGRKTILNARDLRVLEQHCITHRDATVMEITKWAQEHFQKTLSVNTIHRAIRRCQISQKKILEEKMGKDPVKLKGKMSSYAYFVLTCREEHKKKHPEALVNLDEFLKKCSERWKTMSVEEKDRFEEMAKQDKGCYERKMKNSIRPKGEKKRRFKDPSAPKRPPSAFFIFCSEYRPKVKAETPGLSIRDVAKRMGEMWSKLSSDEKQPYEKKAATLKEKYEKDIAAYQQPPANADLKDNEDDDDDDDDDDKEEDNEDDNEEEDDEEEDDE